MKIAYLYAISAVLALSAFTPNSELNSPPLPASQKTEVVCSYAPSQSNLVATVSGAAGGASSTLAAVAKAAGLTVVKHSSGLAILSGSSGYIAGTIGTVGAAPAVFGVALVLGGTAVALELVCASKNYPEQVEKIEQTAQEFSNRFHDGLKRMNIQATKTISPRLNNTVSRIQEIYIDVWDYVNQSSKEVEDFYFR